MNKLTAKGLVNYALEILNNKKTMYMWGGIMRPICQSYINRLAKMYPSEYTEARRKKLSAAGGVGDYLGVDCVGLIKSYYWGGVGSPRYSGETDLNAGGMYTKSKSKGNIGSLPEIPGLILYSKTNPHVGIYCGKGKVIESTLSARGDGVTSSGIKDFKWEYWFKCAEISYEEEPEAAVETAQIPETAEVSEEKPNKSGGNSQMFSVGDCVRVTGRYADCASAETARHGVAVGCMRYVTAVYGGLNFPFQLGVKKGGTTPMNTTGFAKAEGLERV